MSAGEAVVIIALVRKEGRTCLGKQPAGVARGTADPKWRSKANEGKKGGRNAGGRKLERKWKSHTERCYLSWKYWAAPSRLDGARL